MSLRGPHRRPLLVAALVVLVGGLFAVGYAFNRVAGPASDAGVPPSLPTATTASSTASTGSATPSTQIAFADCSRAQFGPALQPLDPPPDVHTYPAAPKTGIQPAKLYLVTMNTSKGVIRLCIQPGLAPVTANVFVSLVRNHFYDGLRFHRVGPSAEAPPVVQGGDPKGDGTGGPGFKFADEPVRNHMVAGTIAMANSGAGTGTNGSQFFINKSDDPALEPQAGRATSYNLFGKVADPDSLAVVSRIVVGDTMETVTVAEQQ